MSCLDNIDSILYINLEHRPDRNEHIINEIKKLDPTLSKTHRINAEYVPTNGGLGCSLSHIKALEFFLEHPEWNTCMILEDDFTFTLTNEFDRPILEMINMSPPFDMILLAYGHDDLSYEITTSSYIHKVRSSQTTSGYIVHRNYANTLLQNFKESSSLIIKHGVHHEACLDQYWKRIMPKGVWYMYHTRIGYQYANYSDIEQRYQNYEC
jgi:GR25 family glycosyltransferase involved in LPS biosynthesis